MNLTTFVVHVDIVEFEKLDERNLVQHPSSSPSISSVSNAAYPITRSNPSTSHPIPRDYDYRQHPSYSTAQYAPTAEQQSMNSSYHVNGGGQQYLNGNGYQHLRTYPGVGYPGGLTNPAHSPMSQPMFPGQYQNTSINALRQQTQGTGVITRNLIGQVSSSATLLRDLTQSQGLWFVFQDLSVRTEGIFRLKFSFFDLQDGRDNENGSAENESAESVTLAQTAPMLAQVYSKPFQVFSAKKFPGVIDSTLLSKEFAKQGIKIPIRKDTNGKRKGGLGGGSGDDYESDAE